MRHSHSRQSEIYKDLLVNSEAYHFFERVITISTET